MLLYEQNRKIDCILFWQEGSSIAGFRSAGDMANLNKKLIAWRYNWININTLLITIIVN
jgi:hypothetical protein